MQHEEGDERGIAIDVKNGKDGMNCTPPCHSCYTKGHDRLVTGHISKRPSRCSFSFEPCLHTVQPITDDRCYKQPECNGEAERCQHTKTNAQDDRGIG